MKLTVLRRYLRENAERALLITLLIILILYFLKEIYLEDIQLQILQIKYRISLNALSNTHDGSNTGENKTDLGRIKKKSMYGKGLESSNI